MASIRYKFLDPPEHKNRHISSPRHFTSMKPTFLQTALNKDSTNIQFVFVGWVVIPICLSAFHQGEKGLKKWSFWMYQDWLVQMLHFLWFNLLTILPSCCIKPSKYWVVVSCTYKITAHDLLITAYEVVSFAAITILFLALSLIVSTAVVRTK